MTKFVANLLLPVMLFSVSAYSAGTKYLNTTITSTFDITNKNIVYNISSTSPGTSVTDSSGGGLYKIQDSFPTANQSDVDQYLTLRYVDFARIQSTTDIVLTGVKSGYQLHLLGKLADSELMISATNATGNINSDNPPPIGCQKYYPGKLQIYGGTLPNTWVKFGFFSSSDVMSNCKGVTSDWHFGTYPPTPPHTLNTMIEGAVTGLYRSFYLDLESLLKTPEYKKAPPDVYVGTNTYTTDALYNYPAPEAGYRFQHTNNVTLTKEPFFDGVALPAGDNVFDIKTVGESISGNVTIPFVMTGLFTPTNKLTVTTSSVNGFSLTNKTIPTKKIPYNLDIIFGNEASYRIAVNGTGTGPVIVTNLLQDGFSLQGRFSGDFVVKKNAVALGEYTDTVTVMFQIALQ